MVSHNIEQIPKQWQLFLVQTTLLRDVVDYKPMTLASIIDILVR